MSALSDIGRLRALGLASAAATLVIIAISMATPYGKELAMPGELRSFHAPLREDCSHCHDASTDAVQSLAGGMAATELTLSQTSRCLVCHDDLQSASRPHGLADEATVEATLEVQCATCHHEHGGRTESLVSMTDAQCQVCHEAAFESFSDGHAEFDPLFGRAKVAIQFDHRQHLQTHLPESGFVAENSCVACHQLDAVGETMLTGSFEETCAACHEDEILGSKQVNGRGFAVLGLPALDVMTLEESGAELGAWPADAEFGESPLSPFLALLLSADPAAREDLAAFRSIDPLDLLEASDEARRVTTSIAWRIKALCAEVLREGHAGIEARLESLAGTQLSSRTLVELCGGLSSEVASASIELWFPNLETELMQRSTGESVAAAEPYEPSADYADEAARESWVQRGGWYGQDLDPSLRYRPRGHDDGFMRAWIEFTHSLRSNEASAESRDVWEQIFDPSSPGVCAKCHLAPEAGGTFVWAGSRRASTTRGLTRFTHATHMPMTKADSCETCHTFDDEGSLGEFEAPNKAMCLDCHGAEGASEACTTCHRYHAQSERLPGLANPLSVRIRGLEDR